MNADTQTSLGTTVQLHSDFDAALARVTEALKAEGFGVLTEIDVRQTLKNKLGVEFPPYRILGACNPPFAHQALTIAPESGLLLPCNVTVAQAEPGVVNVSIIDPIAMMSVIPNPDLRPIAEQVKVKLDRVAQALQQ